MSTPAKPLQMPAFHVPAHEIAIRAEAIDPGTSVFLTANAGSGKTTILTSRVIRLLLEGTEPSRILCVTYTKAAAAEMQNRIFKDLARWVRLDDAALAREVAALTGQVPGPAGLMAARQLFARAVETPGGLKLQTIHAFAERLLHLFPFEANVPARFTVMDDVAKADLIETTKRATIRAALAAPDSDPGRALSTLTAELGESALDELISTSLPLYSGREIGTLNHGERRQHLFAVLGLGSHDTAEAVAGAMLDTAFGIAHWPRIIATIDATSTATTDTGVAQALRDALATGDAQQQAAALVAVFFTDKGTLRKRVLNGPLLKQAPWLDSAIADTAAALPELVDRQRRIAIAGRSADLMSVLDPIVAQFRASKQARGLIDFDDMIERTLQLVAHPGASWVLRKLDGGIDHVLIDEAQDTTPAMWSIASALTEEFFAGAGARKGRRTVFAVGDEKQSIYSFQGARPEAFAENRALFAGRARNGEAPFLARRLQLSFRTVADILNAVDKVFSTPGRAQGLAAGESGTVHETARRGAPGLVELWPLEEQVKAEAREAWEEVDAAGRHSAQVLLAERLARHIAHLIRHERFDDDGARISAGDIMVLVQQRSGYFEAVIRALKRAGVPVAGADRVRLGEEQAVLDLVAAARVALLPDDDLMLANVLKSPLIGLDDADLIALAPERTGSLHAALAASHTPAHRAAHARIAGWRLLAARQAPYAFFATLLGPQGGRKALLERLGPDAGDGIDMFLAGIQAREGRQAPSLLAEIAAFDRMTGDAKRDQDQAGDVVRVLTVHGAKGLEARVVYLADANRLPNLGKGGRLFRLPVPAMADQHVLLWSAGSEGNPALLTELKDAEKADKMDEYRRLFYVAMTRARDRLYIAGWGNRDKISEQCWYGMALAGFAADAAEAEDVAGHGMVRRYRSVSAPAAAPADALRVQASVHPLPDWIAHPLPAEPVAAPPLRPSRAFEAADQPMSLGRETLGRETPGRDLALARGDVVHALLEWLPDVPQAERATLARAFLAHRLPHAGAGRDKMAAQILSQTLALLDTPELAGLFGPEGRSEVPVAGDVTLPDGRILRVAGRIDRLLITPDRILIADYKTGARLQGAGPHLAQLALYRALLALIHPGRPIDCLLIWTREARAERLDAAALDAALTLL